MNFLELKNTAHLPIYRCIEPQHQMYFKRQRNTAAKIICKTFLSATTDSTTTDLTTTDPNIAFDRTTGRFVNLYM